MIGIWIKKKPTIKSRVHTGNGKKLEIKNFSDNKMSNAVAFLYYEDDNEKNNDVRSIQMSLKKNREGPLRKTQFKFYANEMRFEEDY